MQQAHARHRFERTSCAQKTGFRNRERFIGTDVESIRAKQLRLGPPIGAWINRHDAEAYVYENYGRCVRHLIDGTPFENT